MRRKLPHAVIDCPLALVNKINEQIRIIESCNITMERVQESELSLLLPEGELAELEGISKEQMLEIKVYILDSLGENIAKAEKFLQSLQSEKPVCDEPEDVSETAETVTEQQKSVAKEAKSVSVHDKEQKKLSIR